MVDSVLTSIRASFICRVSKTSKDAQQRNPLYDGVLDSIPVEILRLSNVNVTHGTPQTKRLRHGDGPMGTRQGPGCPRKETPVMCVPLSTSSAPTTSDESSQGCHLWPTAD